jgi:hypothetical protein
MKLRISIWTCICLCAVAQAALAQSGKEATVGSDGMGDATDSETRELAQQLFLDGVEFFNEKRLKEAVIKFRAAYRVRPSWRLQYNIGQCEAGLKNYGRAIVAFEKYLGNGGDEVEVTRQDEVLRELDRLKRMVGKIVVDGPEGYAIWVDGEEAGLSPLVSGVVVTIGVVHEVVVREVTSNEEVNRFAVTVIGGETLRLNIAPKESETPVSGGASLLPPNGASDDGAGNPPATSDENTGLLPPTENGDAAAAGDGKVTSDSFPLNRNSALPVDGRRKLSPVLFIISLSTTLAAGVTTAVLLAKINSKWKDAESSYQANPWAYDDAENQSIRNLQVASYVTGGLAILALASTIISIPLTDWHGSSSRGRALNIAPFGTRTATGMVLSGRF